MNNARLFGAGLALVGCLVGFSLLFPNNRRGAPVEPAAPTSPAKATAGAVSPSPDTTPSPMIPLVGEETTLNGRDAKGRKTWELHATAIVLKDAEKKLAADKVRCSFFDEHQHTVATLVARGADMNTLTQDLLFRGQVVATTPKGDRLTIERLLYDGKRKKFLGSGGVHLTRPDAELTADSLVGDPSLKTVRVQGHVVANLRALTQAAQKGAPGATRPGSTPASKANPARRP